MILSNSTPKNITSELDASVMFAFGASKIDKLKIILSENFSFRRNIITGRHEFSLKNENEFYEFNDRIFNSILARIKAEFITSVSAEELRMIIESDFSRDYCPITQYFEELQPWDEKTDHIKFVSDLVRVKPGQFGQDEAGKEIDAQYVWEVYFRKWIVAAVATMLQQGINHTCLTLTGAQGIGKTTFLRKLGIDDNLVYIGSINPADKDSKIYYTEKMLVVLDELEATTKYELAQLKSNMTLPSITVRRPYARRPEVLPRRASFAASANDIKVLSDLTGSRRWFCVEVETIDFMSLTPELMQLVYAQALYMLNTGYKYWMDGKEIEYIERNNKQFYQPLPEEEALFKIVHHPSHLPASYKETILTNTELLQKMSDKFSGVRFSSKKLGQVLAKYNFVRKCRTEDHLQGYEVVIKYE